MPSLVKHAVLLGLALPSTVLAYHFVASRAAADGDPVQVTKQIVEAVGDLTLGSDHDLAYLELLERDLFLVEDRYVEPDRLDPETMFDGALDAVERSLSQVLFVRQPAGRRLQVMVGSYSTTLLLEPIDDLDDVLSELRRVAMVLDQHLDADVDRARVEYTMVNGALSTLDPHTLLLPPADAREMDADNEGEFGGQGIEISVNDGRLIVKQPLDDTPASRAGLEANDHIVRIEDESTINMDLQDAVSRLRGPVGSDVTIRVDRKGLNTPVPFTITRGKIPLNRAEGELLEGDVGYIRIKQFNGFAADDTADQLARFRRESAGAGIVGLILDLRSNPGGYLHMAKEVSDLFLDEGDIVTTVEGGRSPHRETESAKNAGTEPDYPIVVLVNGNSASASEIVAGALRNRKRAVIIGERTFGKGSVQHLFRHRDESKLKLTVAQYLTPGDHSIQSVGIPPDILLRPSLIDPEEDGARSLYWRERVEREADLDKHLEWNAAELERPAYEVRYLLAGGDDAADIERDPKRSWEVGFAREVLLAAPGFRRAEVLRAAGDVVSRRQLVEADRIEAAFAEVGLDWSAGAAPDVLPVDIHLDLGEDGVLVGGEAEVVELVLTNRGEAPLYQLSASLESQHVAFDGREFYFGRVDPGETVRDAQEVNIPSGYGHQLSSLDVVLRSPDVTELSREQLRVETRPQPLPRFRYQLSVDDSDGGDGDGLPEAGEVVDLVVTVENVGDGPTREGFVRLKNRAGRNLDLQTGSFPLGLSEDGRPCEGDPLECTVSLAPGEAHTGRIRFELRELPEDGSWPVELQVGDNAAYDYGTVYRGGFYEYFLIEERLQLAPDLALDSGWRETPSVEVSRAPEILTNLDEVVVSGVVRDARGVAEVMIYQGEDKVFYRGGGPGDQSLPFSIDLTLVDGENTLTILTRNVSGLVSSRTLDTYREPPAVQASEVQDSDAG